MNNNPSELHALIHAGLDGHASDEQVAQLNTLLRSDSDARDRYLQLADIHSCLAVDEQLWHDESIPSRSIVAAPSVSPGLGFASLFARPAIAAAVGLAIGLFGASVVFAYAVPRMKLNPQKVVPLFVEGFEDVKAMFGRGFPNDAGDWSGDFTAIVETEEEVVPKEGNHMARLTPVPDRKFCAAARVIDLSEFPPLDSTESRTVEVTASFHGVDSGWADRNQIRLATFSEVPQDVKAIWNGDSRLDQAMQHIGRTVTRKPGEHGWQTLKVSMEIAAGARSLVIHLGAGVADDSAPKTLHYIDNVRARFLINETIP